MFTQAFFANSNDPRGGKNRHDARRGRLADAAFSAFGAMASMFVLSTAADAQTVLITPTNDPEFNRGRNISVQERAHPDFDPLGVRLGSFILRPSLTVATVTTDNVYLDDSNKRSDVYLNLRPFVSVDSDWSVHRFSVVAAGDIRRYATQTLRNQNAWYIYGHGQLDVHSDANVQLDAQIDQSVESPFFEDVAANLTVPSSYLRTFGAIKASYAPGRARLSFATDVSDFTFNTIQFANGSTRDQRFRNRSVYRAAATYEYGFSPSVALYVQLNGDITNYGLAVQNGLPNRDSNSVALIIGSNFDLAGIARGNIGIGYSRRNYSARNVYPVAQGISIQAKVEFFPSELYTIQILAQRQLQDVNLGNSGAFWNNILSVGVDHEVFDNSIISANVQAIRREFIELGSYSQVYQAQIAGRYQVSRRLGINAELSYGANNSVGPNLGNPFRETRATVGVRLRV